MKKKLITALCVVTILFSATTPTFASDNAAAVVADVVLARPVCFAMTVVGSVFFVVALPFAAASDSVHSTAETLVMKPARATFTRPVGDLDALRD